VLNRVLVPAGEHAELGAEVDAFLAEDSYRNLRALLVVVAGRTVLERYYGGSTPETTYNVQSVGKSILATLIGVAVGEGRLHPDWTLGQLLPAYRSAMSRHVAAIPLRQLLTMTGGLPENFYRHVFRAGAPPDVDWVRTILEAGQDRPAGVFQYSNGSSHLLAAALRQAVGRPVLDYARDRLLTPRRTWSPAPTSFTSTTPPASSGPSTPKACTWAAAARS
jgi:CubicO group peptidase (beta-lactamase class C family)